MNQGIPVKLTDWLDLAQLDEVREAFGIDDHTTGQDLLDRAYGVIFRYRSPGDEAEENLIVLQNRGMRSDPPVIVRWTGKQLVAVPWQAERP